LKGFPTPANPFALPMPRLILALAACLFILAAPDTRWPIVFEVLGWLMLVAAVLIAIVGKERLTRFIMWWVEMPPVAVRTWLVFGFAAGLLIVCGAT